MPREKSYAFVSEMNELSEWSSRAECQHYDPVLWDTRIVNHETEITSDTERAREICVGCPVMMRCLLHAVCYNITTGIYGGLTPEERYDWASREGLTTLVA